MLHARAFGDTGLAVPALGLGAGPLGDPQLADDDVTALFRAAIESGCALVDTAPSYGRSEERLGRLLREHTSDDVILSTKVGYGVEGVPDWTGECIRRGVDRALSLLSREVLDVVHLHSCPKPVLERGDVVRALEDAVTDGKVRVAAYSGDNEDLACALGLDAFRSVQCSVSLVDQASLDDAVPRAKERGLGVIAKRPLANGPWRFEERPSGDEAEPYWERWQALGLGDSGLSYDELALRFVAFTPGVSVAICGTKSAARLRHNAELVEHGPLPEGVYAAVREAWHRHGGWPGRV